MLKDKVAFITGSTSGIGLGIAKAFAEQGASVVINGLSRDKGNEIARRLAEEHNVKAIPACADLTQDGAAAKVLAEAAEELGPVDILVNNAGIQYVAPLEEFPPEKWEAILALNLSAAFHMTRLVVAHMKTAKWGRIINIASAHGLVASPFKAAYVAAKHGLVGLTKVTAMEVAEHGVTCNAICPGYVWTPLVDKQIDDQAKSHGISRDSVIRDVILAPQPNKEFANVEELGGLCIFLSSDNGKSINGAALSVDGGWTAH